MPKPYSDDLRERVIDAVVAGASRREAAESFSLSASSAVRWLQRWRDSGSTRAKLSGGSTSPLEEQVEWLLALVAEQPPDVLFQPHSSVLDMVFYDGEQFPAEYRGDAFVALKGSWNRSGPTGYKVVRVRFKDGRP